MNRPHSTEARVDDVTNPTASKPIDPVAVPTPVAAVSSAPAPSAPPVRTAPAPHAASPDPAPLPAAPASAAPLDIRFEAPGSEGKVDVRLVDRGGDIHVEVRTPDSHLAGSLREDLPALVSRLEQTGFRAEPTHSTAALPKAEAASQTSSEGSERQPGQQSRQQQQQQQPNPRAVNNPSKTAPERKDFEWLLTSLR